MATLPTCRTKVFISYSHRDKKWLDRLQVHLKPLEREGRLDRWDDTRIKPGAPWREEIKNAIAEAKVAVLLISADFLASDFIATDELPPLLAAAKQEGVVILPVIVGPSLFAKTPDLAQFQVVNPPDQPLAGRRRVEQENLLVQVAEAIRDALTDPLAPVSPVPGKRWNVGHDHRFGYDKRTAPMPSLDKSNIHKIVDLLTPLMERENERRALLILALGHDALLLRQLDLTGAVEPFLVNMIKALVDYGEVAPGKQALWALLEVVRERVGVDRQAKIDTLYSVINALGRNDDQGHF